MPAYALRCQRFSEIFRSVFFSFSLLAFLQVVLVFHFVVFASHIFPYSAQLLAFKSFHLKLSTCFAKMIDDKRTFFPFHPWKKNVMASRTSILIQPSIRSLYLFTLVDAKNKLWILCCTERKMAFKHFVIQNKCETLYSYFGGKAFKEKIWRRLCDDAVC